MAMQSLRKGASKGILKYILLGSLAFAAGGLVVMDVGGFFRGGISHSDIGRAGSEKFHISTFDRTIRRTLNRIGMQPEEAFKLGYVDELLNTEIRGALLSQAASKLGIHVSKDHIAKKISAMIEPMLEEGRTPQEVLDQVLLSQGMTEGEFVNSVSREMSNSLLSSSIISGGSAVSDFMAADIESFDKESRDIEVIFFDDSEIKDLKEPTGAELASLYDVMKENYASPETRTVTLITINDRNLKGTIDVSEDDLRAAYEENIAAYSTPEQRRVEQAILSSEEQAVAVSEALAPAGSLKEAVKKVTSAETAYLPAQDFQKDGLLPEISDKVFAAQKGDKIGPVKTALGWHVLVVNDFIAPSQKPFEEVRAKLEEEIKQVRLTEQLYAMANSFDDLMGGGATLEEAAKEVDIETKQLPAINNMGQDKDGKDVLKEQEDNRVLILQTAYEIAEGETSPVMETATGGFMAVQVNAIQPKTYKQLSEVEGELRKRWETDQRRVSNRMRVAAFLAEIETTEKTLKDFAAEKGKAAQSFNAIKRQDEPQKPFSPMAYNIIFGAPVKGSVIVDTSEGSAIVQVEKATLPAEKNEKDVAARKENLARSLQTETLMLYMHGKQKEYGVVVNRDLLAKLYGPSKESE
ncbi:MAG TPA: hypothetical protein DEA55_01395 [Rhodospirillaceae bacterium]|nr:hypothetical protein [Rhodospirillaceae bacterium]